MQRNVLKSKIHRAVVTDANVEYEGSITLDAHLMAAADIVAYERVQILSLDTGERLETYVIEGEAGSGTVCMNGAAALAIGKGETIIVMAYTWLDDADLSGHQPTRVQVDATNRPL